MLRHAIEEASGEMTAPDTFDAQDTALRMRDRVIAPGKTKADS
jgi:hypothetical protein